ncbi:Cytohesin-1 [Gonapodya sp. JEL0774]|nr:Cytohesin-1 [Gonapodya sp. JEL0774]
MDTMGPDLELSSSQEHLQDTSATGWESRDIVPLPSPNSESRTSPPSNNATVSHAMGESRTVTVGMEMLESEEDAWTGQENVGYRVRDMGQRGCKDEEQQQGLDGPRRETERKRGDESGQQAASGEVVVLVRSSVTAASDQVPLDRVSHTTSQSALPDIPDILSSISVAMAAPPEPLVSVAPTPVHSTPRPVPLARRMSVSSPTVLAQLVLNPSSVPSDSSEPSSALVNASLDLLSSEDIPDIDSILHQSNANPSMPGSIESVSTSATGSASLSHSYSATVAVRERDRPKRRGSFLDAVGRLWGVVPAGAVNAAAGGPSVPGKIASVTGEDVTGSRTSLASVGGDKERVRAATANPSGIGAVTEGREQKDGKHFPVGVVVAAARLKAARSDSNLAQSRACGTVGRMGELGRESPPPQQSAITDAARALHNTLLAGRRKFAISPKAGLKYLAERGVIELTVQSVARFLYEEGGDREKEKESKEGKELKGEGAGWRLSKSGIGEYLGDHNSFNIEVLGEYARLYDFTGMQFDQALRSFLAGFRLPGEAQKIDRMMQRFAQRYHDCNKEVFGSADTAYVLAFSIIMLNTDLHNPAIKRKMTKQGFVNNNRGIDSGKDLPVETLHHIYDSILHDEIKLADAETGGKNHRKTHSGQFEAVSDILNDTSYTFANAVKQGWLLKESGEDGAIRTWGKRWCLLVNGCLYYFKDPKDKKPRGIIPLDGLHVEEFSFSDRDSKDWLPFARSFSSRHRYFIITNDPEQQQAAAAAMRPNRTGTDSVVSSTVAGSTSVMSLARSLPPLPSGSASSSTSPLSKVMAESPPKLGLSPLASGVTRSSLHESSTEAVAEGGQSPSATLVHTSPSGGTTAAGPLLTPTNEVVSDPAHVVLLPSPDERTITATSLSSATSTSPARSFTGNPMNPSAMSQVSPPASPTSGSTIAPSPSPFTHSLGIIKACKLASDGRMEVARRTYYLFQCPTEADTADWIFALRSAIDGSPFHALYVQRKKTMMEQQQQQGPTGSESSLTSGKFADTLRSAVDFAKGAMAGAARSTRSLEVGSSDGSVDKEIVGSGVSSAIEGGSRRTSTKSFGPSTLRKNSVSSGGEEKDQT